MKRLGWIGAGLFAIAAIFFAVLNRESVRLDLWPIPIAIEAPLYLFTFGILFFGFLLGLFAMWVSSRGQRQALRAARRELAERRVTLPSSPLPPPPAE